MKSRRASPTIALYVSRSSELPRPGHVARGDRISQPQQIGIAVAAAVIAAMRPSRTPLATTFHAVQMIRSSSALPQRPARIGKSNASSKPCSLAGVAWVELLAAHLCSRIALQTFSRPIRCSHAIYCATHGFAYSGRSNSGGSLTKKAMPSLNHIGVLSRPRSPSS